MEAELRNNLTVLATLYGEAKKLELVTVARHATGDWRFFDRVSNGKASFTAKKYDSIVGWFAANWPAGLEWPVAVSRPETQTAA